MTQLQREVEVANYRVIERRKELQQQLNRLITRPIEQWSPRDKQEIRTLIQRITALIV